jgi:hypothetical protein
MLSGRLRSETESVPWQPDRECVPPGQTSFTAALFAGGDSRIVADPYTGLNSGGLRPTGSSWADRPSIFTFAVRDPADPTRLLAAAELRPFHERLAQLGVLLGQPVSLGSFGGLRIAIGAQDLLNGCYEDVLARVFAALEQVTLGDHGNR